MILKTRGALKTNCWYWCCHHHIENTKKGEEQFLTLSNFLRQNQISALFFCSRLLCSRRQLQIQNSFEKRNNVAVDLSKILWRSKSTWFCCKLQVWLVFFSMGKFGFIECLEYSCMFYSCEEAMLICNAHSTDARIFQCCCWCCMTVLLWIGVTSAFQNAHKTNACILLDMA
jgi:hypothetical protein